MSRRETMGGRRNFLAVGQADGLYRAVMAAKNDGNPAGKNRGTLEILCVFLRLGCTSFGGPVAHLGYFQHEFVERRKWLTGQAYAGLVALCQFLPGPASSQVGFAIGLRRGGLSGALAAWAGFTLPSAVLMVLFALGVARLGALGELGWVAGLKTGAVAVVAHAVASMAENLCRTRATAMFAMVAAVVLVAIPLPGMQMAVMAAGAIAGLLLRLGRSDPLPDEPPHDGFLKLRFVSPASLGLFFLLLVGLPVLASALNVRVLDYASGFYLSGSLVFGGGHVILPLLQQAVVDPGWVGQDAFLAGYGAAQALPGPLFTFSAYLGVLMDEPPCGLAGAVVCLLAIFLPSMLLIPGVLPYWERLRSRRDVLSALTGTNAVVVGLLAAALYNPVFIEGVRRPLDLVVAVTAFALLRVWRQPAWLVVALCGGIGWFTHGH